MSSQISKKEKAKALTAKTSADCLNLYIASFTCSLHARMYNLRAGKTKSTTNIHVITLTMTDSREMNELHRSKSNVTENDYEKNV